MNSFGRGVGRRYELQAILGQGGMGVVYQALDRLTGQPVALKRVTAPTDQIAFSTYATLSTGSLNRQIALAHEFKTLASLRHPYIISVLDYGFDEMRQPYFTMDLLHDVCTLREAAATKSNTEQVRLLVELLHALAYLHRRGVLHRDLKPANVLVVDDHVKLLDFGLALNADHTKATGISGTFAYIAPEIFLHQPPTTATDLYAVGVIAYEIFTGHYPFDTSHSTKLIQQTLTQMPDVTGIPEPFGGLIARLLAKTPAERPRDAQSVIRGLTTAEDAPFADETPALRESFLQAAQFIGRDSELATLTVALRNAVEGRGSAWLIGGESGVGKSRLVDELRALALVEGAVVLRGVAVSEGGRSYQVWRETLRWLAAFGGLSGLEASILKPFVPDMARLHGADVPDAPEIDPQVAQIRLFAVVRDVMRRLDIPLVLLLEDMQWAGEESALLLDWLSEITTSGMLLIVANYRDDESPDLPMRLPHLKLLKLRRLPASAIADLSEIDARGVRTRGAAA